MHTYIRGGWLCSSAVRAQSTPQSGILQPLGCSVSIQVPGTLAGTVCMSNTRLQPLGFSVSPGLQLGWFFLGFCCCCCSVCCRKLTFYLICGLSPRADVVPPVISAALHDASDPPCSAWVLQGCCGTAAIAETLFAFRLSPSFIAEINKSRRALCDGCSSCCSCFPYVDTYLSEFGKNRNTLIRPPQGPSVGAISSG